MSSPSRGVRWRRRMLGWAFGWLLSGALYLLLIDITDLPELIVGAGAAVLAATGFELACGHERAGQTARPRWARGLHRSLIQVPFDVTVVSVAALTQLAHPRAGVGAFRVTSFSEGERESAVRGRRALTESLGSFAPNTIVIGVDGDRELILAHQLRRAGGAEGIDVLGLGAG